MTKPDLIQQLERTYIDDTQQPFHIVLIDIAQAVHWLRIKCVKVPFPPEDDEDLNYVVISYRWGELSETFVNTGVNYLSSVTSFDIFDFINLCETIMCEPELRHIKYVWVDAICVNQTNYEQRKATIYYMSKIYERANFILAVPDLHLAYLENTTVLDELISYSGDNGEYIHHLLHGNVKALIQADLDLINNHFNEDADPTDPNVMRRSIQLWNDHVVERNQRLPKCIGFMMDLVRDWATRVWVVSEYHIAKNSKDKQKLKYWFLQIKRGRLGFTHTYFEFDFANPPSPSPLEFEQADDLPDFAKESTAFTQSMQLASDLYLKFRNTMAEYLVEQNFLEMMLKTKASKNEDRFYAVLPHSDKYKHHLNKSAVASWNINTAVSVRLKLFDWMDTVDKLGLFYMTCREDFTAFTLGFPTFATAAIDWDGQWFYKTILKEAAAASAAAEDDDNPCLWNFDKDAPLTLIHPDHGNNSGFYKLDLRPKEYYWDNRDKMNDAAKGDGWRDSIVFKQLELNDPSVRIEMVAIPFYVNSCVKKDADTGKYNFVPILKVDDSDETAVTVLLLGNFKQNKWMLAPRAIWHFTTSFGNWELYRCNKDNAAATHFYVY